MISFDEMVKNDQGRPRQRVITACRSLILDGTLPQGGILPSEQVLAERLGAKRGVVNLALRELEREGLVQSQSNGRRLVTGGRPRPPSSLLTNAIGVYTAQPHIGTGATYPHGWAAQTQSGLIDGLCRLGRHVVLLHPGSLENEQRNADVLAMPPLGFATSPSPDSAEASLRLLTRLHELGVAVVTEGDGPAYAAFDRVVHDHAAGAEQLTRLLLARGRRRIARCWVPDAASGEAQPEWLRQRDVGHERALAAAGVPALPGLATTGGPKIDYFADRSVFEGEVRRMMACLEKGLVGPERCDALMLASDGLLPQIAEACRRLGREPGHDLDLVGYDNCWRDLDHQRFASAVPLATIDQDYAGIGVAMAELLEERLAGRLPVGPQRRLRAPKLLEPHNLSSI